MYVPDDKTMGNPGVLGLVTGVIGAVTKAAGGATTELHIQDRVRQYQSFPAEKLRAIISTYGGEMAEAARRVLSSRGEPETAPASATPSVPAFAVPQLAGFSGWALPVAIGAGLLLLAKRK